MIIYGVLLIIVAIRITKAEQHKQDMLERMIKNIGEKNHDAR